MDLLKPKVRPAAMLVAALFALGIASTPLREPTDRDVTKARERGEYITLKEMQHGLKLVNGFCGKCHAIPSAKTGLNRDWAKILSRMAKKAKLDSTNTWRIRVYMESIAQDSLKTLKQDSL